LFRRLRKKLTCPACGDVIADAAYRPWPGDLNLTTVAGAPLQPVSVTLQLRSAQQRLAEATTTGEEATVRARIEFLRRNIGELIYDLRCHHGHSTLCTMPEIARAMRRTPGDWISIRAGSR
jgi:hypothetical protein